MYAQTERGPDDIAIKRGMARAGILRLAYEDWGDPASPVLLMIMGLGAQMVLWPDAFCRELVKAGLRMIRFDNRDVGLSDRVQADTRGPSLWRLMLRAQFGRASRVPYSLVDMARDTAMLMDALHLQRAHVVGASMGGMIGQVLAATQPDRVATLTLLFSSTNQPLLPPTSPALLWKMLRGPPPDAAMPRQKAHAKGMLRALGTRRYPVPEAELDQVVDSMAHRGFDAAGVRRQLMAVLGTGDLRPFCGCIRSPTQVIHGEKDRMLPMAAGKALARAIPGADLHIVPGMGHDLPPALWPFLVDLIVSHVAADLQRPVPLPDGPVPDPPPPPPGP
ncbi:hypothetical protein AKI39_06665 [Bordetella sp. H567]|uniref:alpha/beta fold hydrolase n=1 Tax=Bordetella sp. H567 TaxID=1697043 RepID=UPI00081CFF15|nr:alpha/beta hydrolase [Bordetella sp. H567]AOB30444.1 hypothetical protein AKI39_06665 [Bordetella sp. H567]